MMEPIALIAAIFALPMYLIFMLGSYGDPAVAIKPQVPNKAPEVSSEALHLRKNRKPRPAPKPQKLPKARIHSGGHSL